jgi:error-prone DNA polymerase
MMTNQPYVELHCHSAYSFLDGASLPEELAVRAAELGYPALALTDHDGVYGSLEFAHAAKPLGVRPITGAEVTLDTHPPAHVTLLVESSRGYANLCRLLTAAHSRERLNPALDRTVLEELSEGLVCLSGCARHGLAVRDPKAAARLARAFGRERFYVELQRPYQRGDAPRNAALRNFAADLGVRTVATGDVHAHHPRRTRLQDVLVAIRAHTSLDGCETERRGNEEAVLQPPAEMAARFPDDPDALRTTVELAERLEFDLTQELGYRYPDFADRVDPADIQLARLCRRAFEDRYRHSPHRREADTRLTEELALIAELGLSGFFLLHWEVLELAREVATCVRAEGSPRHALPPGRGRGSSVGSIVCYLTGLSHVDPVAAGLPLGRFLNRELAAVPDIDLDFPRDIREKLIVAVCDRYGREHAALVASFATYRSRGAIREVGKALGLPAAELERLARVSDGWDARNVGRELSMLPDAREKLRSPRWQALPGLCAEIAGLPRHISQHPGGMVISTRPLVELVPVEPAAMEGRQLCQWDKDSCGDAGFLKIDLLGLGMLSAVEECIETIARHSRARSVDLSRIPLDDAVVYREIQAADTVGVFQIESRAQMQMLVRTLPENLDDLTVEVALVRPGPIQGGAVHPYIERRQRLREDPAYAVPYDHPLLEEPLRETLGVVVFQEQVLEVAIALAGFTVGEAEGLRRAMSRKRSHEAIEAYRQRFLDGAAANGVDRETSERVFGKLSGFASFGFPKSHAAAFGLLAYQSAWLRHHHPAEFLCALLNAQPMGFYPPSSLIRDGQRRGVEVLPPDVNRSEAKCTLQGNKVRIGLAYVKGVGEEPAETLVAERADGAFRNVQDLAHRAPLDRPALEALVASGACDSFGWPRRQLLWRLGLAPRSVSAGADGTERQLALPLEPTTEIPELPQESPWELMLADYRTTALSVRTHPLELLRPHLPSEVASSLELAELPHGEHVTVAGLAIARQRPATANGVVFMLLEDEHGQINLIVPPPVYERHRAAVRAEPLLLARGRFESNGRNRNVVVDEIASLAPLARRAANDAEVTTAMPGAHSFGRR